MPTEKNSPSERRSRSQKLERSLRKLRALDRLLKWPKLSAKGERRLTHAHNIQRDMVKLRRKALSAARSSGDAGRIV